MNPQIEIAKNEDEIEQCRKIINEVFRETQHVARKDRDTIPLEGNIAELSGKDRELFMLYHSGSFVGTVLLTLHEDSADIRYLAITAASRGLEFGKQLMQYAEARTKTVHRKKRVGLATIFHPEHPQTALQQWYKNQGYRYSDTYPPSKEQKCRWFAPEYYSQLNFRWFEKKLD